VEGLSLQTLEPSQIVDHPRRLFFSILLLCFLILSTAMVNKDEYIMSVVSFCLSVCMYACWPKVSSFHCSDVLQPFRQVLRCSAVKSSVDNDRQFELDALGCS